MQQFQRRFRGIGQIRILRSSASALFPDVFPDVFPGKNFSIAMQT